MHSKQSLPLIMPLGDRGLLIRFGDSLSEQANLAAISFGRRALAAALAGVEEVVPNLVSVLLRYDPRRTDFERLAGEVRLLQSAPTEAAPRHRQHVVSVVFDGPDLSEVARATGLGEQAFIAAHCEARLHVLATGFAPGFLYCGFHDARLHVPRRAEVRRQVPAGSVLFAARQTAITSTVIPTGWHVIGHTDFRNFSTDTLPPTQVEAGDIIRFRVAQ